MISKWQTRSKARCSRVLDMSHASRSIWCFPMSSRVSRSISLRVASRFQSRTRECSADPAMMLEQGWDEKRFVGACPPSAE